MPDHPKQIRNCAWCPRAPAKHAGVPVDDPTTAPFRRLWTFPARRHPAEFSRLLRLRVTPSYLASSFTARDAQSRPCFRRERLLIEFWHLASSSYTWSRSQQRPPVLGFNEGSWWCVETAIVRGHESGDPVVRSDRKNQPRSHHQDFRPQECPCVTRLEAISTHLAFATATPSILSCLQIQMIPKAPSIALCDVCR